MDLFSKKITAFDQTMHLNKLFSLIMWENWKVAGVGLSRPAHANARLESQQSQIIKPHFENHY